MKDGNCYIAIDLKSFYASVECVDRGLDPLDTHLVVADEARTDKTICLAVTPSLKAYGISGRGRLYEVKQRVKEVNEARCHKAPGRRLEGTSHQERDLKRDPKLALDFIIATPRMARYIEYSKGIYEIYLKYVAHEDMLVYSIDEVFLDVSKYLSGYKLTPRELAGRIMEDVFVSTGITATAGIGSNLFLCKVAMDITAKHSPPDKNGVRIAELDEDAFRETMWDHQPLTDFWRIGMGTAKKLVQHGMYTLGDVAKQSHEDEGLLYRLFGKNAQLLIDHAWGYESCTMADIKAYKPRNKSLSTGQILPTPYETDKAKLVIKEMTYALALDMVEKGLVCKQLVLYIGYDVENLLDEQRREAYKGPVITDSYGRKLPYHSVGTGNLEKYTASAQKLLLAICGLFDSIVDKSLLIRRMSISANQIQFEEEAKDKSEGIAQLDLFRDFEDVQACYNREKAYEEREKRVQQALLDIKNRYGKNAILRGLNLEEGATAQIRNESIGGHRA